jgi:cyclophilin family peptidyl-prolyl cis-trans isomerase
MTGTHRVELVSKPSVTAGFRRLSTALEAALRASKGRTIAVLKPRLTLAAALTLLLPLTLTAQTSPGAGPVIVLETVKGNIEFETYPEEAPKTVAQIVALVKRNFYNGLRFHRAEYDLIQIGDPATRNMLKRDMWGRGNSGKPIGVAEITKKRRHLRGAVAMAYPGTDAKLADSQFYITTKAHPELDAKYTVFGRVIKGIEVVDKIQVADVVKKAYVKEGPATP